MSGINRTNLFPFGEEVSRLSQNLIVLTSEKYLLLRSRNSDGPRDVWSQLASLALEIDWFLIDLAILVLATSEYLS